MGLPPDQVALARVHRRRQQQLAMAATAVAARVWADWTTGPVLDWWNRRAGARVLRTLIGAQLEAARGADRYVSRMLQLAGADLDPVGEVPARAFAGTAADGRPLDSLLRSPAFEVDAFVRQGMPTAQAKAIGNRHLRRIVASETADAARVATGVALVNDRSAVGYVRLLTPPSCARCIILAGRWYRWSNGFLRHPQCDCIHVPAGDPRAGGQSSPREVFDSLSEADQDRVFTKAGAQAIRDGADISRVVNARLGIYTAGGRRYTTSATTRRGTGRRIRLTPEQIYLDAADRDDAIRLLKLHGYIR